MENTVQFRKVSFGKDLSTMLKVDLRRMFKSRLFYILLACALLVPIVMTVMLTMMDGQENVNPQTGEVTIMEGPESVWESIGTFPVEAPVTQTPPADGAAAMGDMDVMAMCNINMMFMAVAVFVCLFVSDDFRSGYAKNLFTVRAKKGAYVVSKTVAGFLCGAGMLLLYFLGSVLSAGICGLSFDLGTLTPANLVFCMLAKIFLMLVFVPIFLAISVAAKQKAWLSLCGSLGGGMILFMMVGMITPLNATALYLVLCLAGGMLFAIGLGLISKVILNKTSLV